MAKFNVGDDVFVIHSDPAGHYHYGQVGTVIYDEKMAETIASLDQQFPGFAADTLTVKFLSGEVLYVGVDDVEAVNV